MINPQFADWYRSTALIRLLPADLGMLVSTDFHIPLFHRVYAGNVPDSTEFRSITEELAAHYSRV